MNTSTLGVAALTLAMGLSGAAQAALQGRDLNGSAGSFEAYYDTVLNITWLADANYAQTSGYDADGKMTWAAANTWAANLSFTDGVKVYDNWRLPTVEPVNGISFNYTYMKDGSTDYGYNIISPQSEMAHLYYVTLGNPGFMTPAGVVSGCYVNITNTCLDNAGPFSNLQTGNFYWSGSVYATYQNYAWYFYFSSGIQDLNYQTGSVYAMAVSPGDVAAVPEADTWVMLLVGLGLVGCVTGRRRL